MIENEFGEAGVDNEILVQGGEEQIIEMNNGCVCCTIRGDLTRILGDLKDRREAGAIGFDRVIIETTGMADPGPVAQTFFLDEAIGNYYLLDSVITLVDAMHGGRQLDEFREAQEQVGFADRILLSKTDLVSEDETERLRKRLLHLNPRAPIRRVHFGQMPIEEILDIRGFNLTAVLEIDPGFLAEGHHHHDDDVTSFVWKDARPLDMEKIETFLSLMAQNYGEDLLRYKGILNIQGEPRRMIFQGVHMLMGGTPGKPWSPGEARESVMVFIGRRIPAPAFRGRPGVLRGLMPLTRECSWSAAGVTLLVGRALYWASHLVTAPALACLISSARDCFNGPASLLA